MPSKRISVTGFQSFGSYDVNPSEIIVSRLEKHEFSKNLDVDFRLVAVNYEVADACSEQICGIDTSDFVIHIGVHPVRNRICLEKQAKAFGYCSHDVNGQVPLHNRPKVCNGQITEVLQSNLDTDEVIKNLKGVPDLLEVKTSHDPGRYLCSYIFYSSLENNKGNALFIHIPTFSEVATVDVVSNIVAQVIESIGKVL
ncbi:unnamed protein product [Bursaphelenchus okinawaensis]|uniref:Pyroglutamyl-peptidase I n=1 Tax=Bursaphelenchus okinawaensis TaxID=465554 RepID=A0A811JRM3_9BILA|nr:unnamed protein product [Bursaphelenchus okinawaensis]CAG9080422.1 unnamed protein product [Bursaphelenchus okinawaensis]